MADRIKGITIEINGDTTKLTKALSDTNKSIRETQTQLKDVEKLLKLDPTNITLLRQKQELLSKAVDDTRAKLERLRDAQKQMDLSGVDKSSDQYRALQREIVDTEQQLKKLEKTARESNATLSQIGSVAQEISNKTGEWADKTRALSAAAAGALGAIGAVTGKAVEAFAENEQLVGGTKLLFGDAYDYIAQKATEAYSKVQLSQNDYLEQVNRMAVGLKEALGGNSQAAAELADKVITAEADVVAATGASQDAVQNAFNGIMKSNYTMLDNLQLGIKPTKEGFQELIDKVNEWNAANGEATQYQIDNLADCQSALVDYIEMQGLAGYAAKEGTDTISGSYATLQAAIENFLTVIGQAGGDVEGAVQAVLAAVKNFAGQVIEVLKAIWDNLPDWAQFGIEALAVVAMISPLLSTISAISGAISGLTTIISAVSNPVGLVVVAIAALVAAFVALWNNCEGFREFWINLWDKIKEAAGTVIDWLKTAFENIKAFFTPVIEAVQNAFGKLADKVRSDIMPELQKLWQAIQEHVIPIFKLIVDTIKINLQPAFELLKTGLGNLKIAFQTAWDAIKLIVSNTFENIKVVISTAWNVIKTIVSTALDVLKNVIKTATAIINGDWKAAWEGIKNIFSSIWNGIKTIVSTVWSGIKSIFQNNLDTIKAVVSRIFDGIKSTIQNTIDGAKNIVKSGLDAIKSFFANLKISFPKIKLPYFTITGKFSLDPPSMQKISVSWYAKAMQNAMLLNGATIFGAMGGKLLGGGEAGQEVVAGANTLMNMIEKAVKNTMFGDSAITSNALSGTVRHTGTIRIEGVNNRGEFVAAGNAVVDSLGLRDIARFVMDEMQAETERKAAVY